MKIFLLLFLVFFLSDYSFSQFIPVTTLPVFPESEVPRVDVFISQGALDSVYNPDLAWSDFEHRAKFVFTSTLVSDTLENVGFRLRGNTSRVSQKKSFKVSFNGFVPGRKFYGLEKLNLNGEHNDPCIVRAKLTWDLFRDFGCAAARSGHVALYINNVYYGLYINVEHIDEQFVKSRFGNNNGNLYKCLYPADLVYISSNPADYKLTIDGRRVYDLKTNNVEDNYTDLAYFIGVLNQTPLTSLPEQLEPIFNVNGFLKILAVDVLTANWDGYAYNKNNFYLYHNTLTNQFEYIPYDVDNTFGIDWFNIDWGTRNIYNWAAGESRPLVKRLLQVPEYKARFSFYLNQLLADFFATDVLNPKIDVIKNQVYTFAQNDNFRTLDYGWDMDAFNQSFTESLGDHVKYGLKPFISARHSSALSQISLTNIHPIIEIFPASNLYSNQPLQFQARVMDESSQLTIALFYQVNDGEWQSKAMFDNGLNNDGIEGDKIFGAIADPIHQYGFVNYYIVATDWNQLQSRAPQTGFLSFEVFSGEVQRLYINEFMAINTSTLADEVGGYGDWIEIYNAGDEPISLSGFYLTDKFETPSKFPLPDTILQAGGFALIWADNDPEQGPFHTNFNLDGYGEEIGLFYKNGDNYSQVDKLKFYMQREDVSYGRYTDGGSFFYPMFKPTPLAPNLYDTVKDTPTDKLRVFPNPAVDKIKIQSDLLISGFTFQIYSLFGERIANIVFSGNENEMDVRFLSPGFYVYVAKDGTKILSRGKILKCSF